MTDNLSKQLRQEEGEKLVAYQDHLGYWTIGVGRLIDGRKNGGISHEESTYLLNNDISRIVKTLSARFKWFSSLNEPRQAVLVQMAFQMGTAGLFTFTNTLSLIELGLYEEAAANMLKSKWATQTPARAKRLSEQMRTGNWVWKEKP
jgi:lysozyme